MKRGKRKKGRKKNVEEKIFKKVPPASIELAGAARAFSNQSG
jgi:hypothetical protein